MHQYILVKLGLHHRGLCCHWVENLHLSLCIIDSQSIKFGWVVVRYGRQLWEYSRVIVYVTNSIWLEGGLGV